MSVEGVRSARGNTMAKAGRGLCLLSGIEEGKEWRRLRKKVRQEPVWEVCIPIVFPLQDPSGMLPRLIARTNQC
jgi:hypothetical protein